MGKHSPIPVIHYDAVQAQAAYLAHVAMITAEIQDPTLRDNPAWTILRQDAYAMFRATFDGEDR